MTTTSLVSPYITFKKQQSSLGNSKVDGALDSCLEENKNSSLVKAAISPTPPILKAQKEKVIISESLQEFQDMQSDHESRSKGFGCRTIIQKRSWSEETRIRTVVETSYLQPPINMGPRISNSLTDRAQRKLIDSACYMAACQGGYKAFVTATFSAAIREAIESGETTIQKEVTRMMDSAQKMYQRGWLLASGNKINGYGDTLSYCWVVETPKNGKGTDNPHVHMMFGWEVKIDVFKEWAARLESMWGNGYFHIEKIRDPLCAGAYIAKSAGFKTRSAAQGDQGCIKGNRYGISKSARAPGWYTVSEAEMGIMGKLIAEIHDRQLEQNQFLYQERNKLKRSLKNSSNGNIHIRQSLKEKLSRVQSKIYQLPVVSSRYQLIFRTSKSLNSFLDWAIRSGWDALKKPTSRWLGEFNRRMALRKQARVIKRNEWTDTEWTLAAKDYFFYQSFKTEEYPNVEWEEYCHDQNQ